MLSSPSVTPPRAPRVRILPQSVWALGLLVFLLEAEPGCQQLSPQNDVGLSPEVCLAAV